ncbi:MAG TPA: signal peptidase I [Candidatus Saccharimonadia bacterium]|nr:signal peptidase I [Candidatus Saccharimonadia bacterium]
MLKAIKIIAISIYAVCGGLLILFAIPSVGWKALEVATGSMTPAIPQGSLVIIHKVSPMTLKVGNVVTYIDPYNTKLTITHRIIKVTTKSGLPAFVTKGDANKVADREILGGNVVGKVEWHVPHLGNILSYLHKPLGLVVIIFIPALFIIFEECRRLARSLRAPPEVTSSSAEQSVGLSASAAVEPAPVETDATVTSASLPPRSASRRAVQPSGNTLDLRHTKPIKPIRHLVVLAVVSLLAVRATYAMLNTSVTLATSSISTVKLPTGTTGGNTSCKGTVIITNTGPGSKNKVTCVTKTSTSTSTTNITNITNVNAQSASSGSSNGSSGTAGNGSSTSTGVTNTNK